MPAATLSTNMKYLFDVSFVVPEGGMVRLSDPLVNAVIRAFARGWSPSEHSKVARELERYLSDTDDDDARFVLARSLYRALNQSGRGATSEYAIRLTADIVELSQHYYHERDYDNAIQYCELALDKRPDNVNVRSYLVRALIQKGQFSRADQEIHRIVDSGHLRDAWFLRGFYYRYQNQYPAAVNAYKNAIEVGRKGVAVHRDLAQCYHEIGNIPLAKYHIEEAQKRDPDNRYIVDLQIQIAIKQGENREAIERLLARLEVVDDERFFYHRRSTVRYHFHEVEPAYIDAKEAFSLFDRPPFAILSQLIKTEIETDRLPEAAEHLTLLDATFGSTYHDFKLGLATIWMTKQIYYDMARGTGRRFC